jgi:hypothetical protein
MKSVLVGIVCLVASTGSAAQDSLSAAKDLYASAAYEDALAALMRLREHPAPQEVSQEIDQYRAFCLVALGRTTEAESVAETLIKQNPLLRLDAGETAPRIEAMFTNVRKRLLPGLIRAEYQSARAAIGQKDFAAAESQLKEVRGLLDEAQSAGVSDNALDDLRLTVDGFLDLARAASEARVAALPAEVQTPDPVSPRNSSVPEPPPSPPPVTGAPRIYDSTSTDVDPPIAIFQRAPSTSWPRELSVSISGIRKPGTLSIVIGETGNVEDAAMIEPVQPVYDRLLLVAARGWKYRPATKAGVPVRYRKTIRIELKEPPD